ncbi:MerR family DNA-binding transcriptional regulator [Rhodoblastus sp.]|jgi:DNA-binding transcriptional MerR regulator|uniref:MerR family transcriptional regulator n=1 Tax=Rhodoblastus sp. TaxID=1962975 RepID=UPI00262BA6C1|nr:MerR family DNA-binding transcriptional regulator [Rhodoblastus sp.]
MMPHRQGPEPHAASAAALAPGRAAATARTYSIAQLASELGVSLRAIRFYEAKGLIAPQRVGASRVYSHRDRARLILILRGKRMGFSLKDIQEFLDLYVVDATQVTQMRSLLGKVRSRIGRLETQLQDVQTSLAELRDVERVTQDILATKGAEKS